MQPVSSALRPRICQAIVDAGQHMTLGVQSHGYAGVSQEPGDIRWKHRQDELSQEVREGLEQLVADRLVSVYAPEDSMRRAAELAW